jgi:hypothetical protein
MAENKERLEGGLNEQIGKTIEIVDLQKNREAVVPREVRSWMEKVEEDPSLDTQSQQIKGDDDSVLQTIAPAAVKIVLPTDKNTFSDGFNKTFGDAGRWLSEFVFRVIKKNKGNVKFNEE